MFRRFLQTITACALLVVIVAASNAQAVYSLHNTIVDTIRITDCEGEDVFLRGAENTSESSYLWQQTELGKNITIPYQGRTYTYTVGNTPDTIICEVVATTVNAKNNLMASGDFETCPPDFESDYQYAFDWDKSKGCNYNSSNFYSECPGNYKSNIYAITANANTFWRNYQVRRPHGGQYFALFDAGKEGYAWKAETTKGNPNLKLQKDSTYLFSYWVAHPNANNESNSPAELQFVLILRNGTLKADTVDLGAPHKLYQGTEKDKDWHKVEVQWTNTLRDCDDVIIGVYDRNGDAGVGNDFCLDDIMFQNTAYISTEVLYRTVFIVRPKPQAECCPTVLNGNPVDTTVCLQDLPFVWQKTIYGETFRIRVENTDATGTCKVDTVVKYKTAHIGCDSIRFAFRVHTQDCHTCPPVVEAAPVDTVVCYDTPFPFQWRGYSFNSPDATGVSTVNPVIKSLSDPACDSLSLTFRIRCTAQPVEDNTDVSLCEDELPYQWIWLSQPIRQAGDYLYTEKTVQGCDSIRHTLHLSIIPNIIQYKKWADVVFIPDSAGRYTSYQWYHNAQPIANAVEQFYHAPEGLSGLYHCVMQTVDGTTEQSCPQDFDAIARSADENAGAEPVRRIVALRTMWISPVFRVKITTYSDNTIQAEKQCVIQH